MTENKRERPLGILELLDQDEIWYARQDGQLVVLRLDEMTQRHLANLRGWLLDNAGRAHSSEACALYGFASFIGGEQASYDLDAAIGALEEQDPREWMREKPLFQAITRRITGRPQEG